MTTVKELVAYFSDGIRTPVHRNIGMEVETSFLTREGVAISEATSQKILTSLLRKEGMNIAAERGGKITALKGEDNEQYFYELGRQNIELSSSVHDDPQALFGSVRKNLNLLYKCAHEYGAYPLHAPLFETGDDLLMVPDERDETWVQLDGREVLRPLATITAVQFTIDVSPEEAITALNRLGEKIKDFLEDYPQERVWRTYVRDSLARYHSDRYGGPLRFESLTDCCEKLALHDVVQGGKLVPYGQCKTVDIPLYLRSIWWYFRLKRYGESLCIEIRPLPRRVDALFERQLQFVLDAMNL